MESKLFFDRLAEVIMVFGTTAVRREFEQLAERVRDTDPGAAEALTDWEGAEIARERAFAVIRNRHAREENLDKMRDFHIAHSIFRGVA